MIGTRPALASFLHRATFAALFAATVTAARIDAQGACRAAIEYGMNPSFHTWSSRAIVLADALARARSFSYFELGQMRAAAPLIALGSGRPGAGWPDPAALGPGERYGAYLFGSMEGTLPDGRAQPYVIAWKGAGSCRLEGAYVVSERNRTDHRVEVFVDPTRGTGNSTLSCTWTATDPADPVRDVRVWLPGMESSGQLFWTPFLEKARAMNAGRGPHTWRVLDWARINEYGRPLTEGGFRFDLAGRTTPRSASQGTPRGMCPEYQVAFCNALGANLHFQVPHRTDDMSVADYAAFLRQQLLAVRDGSPAVPGLNGGRAFAGLDPSLTVTLELSNEIWNAGFPVHHWMKAEAARNGITFHQQIAREIELVFDLADTVFTGVHAARLRRYVGGFQPDPSYLEQLLRELRPDLQIDAAGPAIYFGPRRADVQRWMSGASSSSCPNCPTPEEVLASARLFIPTLREDLDRHRRLLESWTNPDGSHPAFVLYEAGPSFRSGFQPWAGAAKAAQLLPGMFDALVQDLVPLLVEEGVDLVHWYSFMTDQDPQGLDPFGMWNDMGQELGLPVAEPYLDEGAPKAAAICLGPPLDPACASASAFSRSAGTNLGCYAIRRPILGRRVQASVDLRASGNAAAVVMAALAPAQVALDGGQFLLIAPASASFLPERAGPLAAWALSVPNDPALAGLRLSTQALCFGGGNPPTFSNAMDLVFGRD